MAFLMQYLAMGIILHPFNGFAFSLVAYLIIDLAKFYLPIIALLWVIHDLFRKCIIIILHLFTLLKMMG
jgi:hypothetical protein